MESIESPFSCCGTSYTVSVNRPMVTETSKCGATVYHIARPGYKRISLNMLDLKADQKLKTKVEK